MLRSTLLSLLLAAPVLAETPVLVRFHTDPPSGVNVSVRVTGIGAFDKAESKPHLLGSSGEYLPLPQGLTDYDLELSAPQHKSVVLHIRKYDLQPGNNEWPKDQAPIVLQAQSPLAALSQFYRLNPVLSLGLGALIVGLSGYLVYRQTLNVNKGSWDQRIRALGGDPTDKPIGPFVPVGELGRGGYGVVVKAIRKDQLFRKKPEFVAVKTLLGISLDERVDPFGMTQQVATEKHHESRRQRFTREAQTLERLDHPNIVRLVHYSLVGSSPYLAMEFIPGKNFRQLLQERGRPYSPAGAWKLIKPVCQAMYYAHSQKPSVVHRDIKPENLMVSDEGEVKVMDLGLAHSLGEIRLTATADWTGTAQYAPVEYFQGVVTPSLDQFSIGLVLQELITGAPANPQMAPEQAATIAILGHFTRLGEVHPELGAFAEAVDRMCHQDYTKRFPTLQDAITELDRTVPKG